MKNYTVIRYQTTDAAVWNDFLDQADQASFLFHRNFMDYHADRFLDFSLMIYEGSRLVALLPANAAGNTLYSHQGLTYGGLVYGSLRLHEVIAVFRAVLYFAQQNGFTMLSYKCLPPVYCLKPRQECDYALFLAKARLVRRDTLSVIESNSRYKISALRRRGIKKGVENQLAVREEHSFEAFWNQILIPNLGSRHQTRPVHSLEEIQRLASQFPQSIRHFNVYHQDTLVAGTTIFETPNVAHAQYIAANETRADLGSLDFLFDTLIRGTFREKKFFDFGISNESMGQKLNAGLSYWKESFGATTMVQDFYEVDTAGYVLLDDVLI
ncbi:GNAT family N-acetyltransferase [Flavobacterium magnum]|uniref:GNAT family N-acetyltransferase n=1 Tax=Flavobacterium magnum TaxID=2162713 RepID=A0A2S0RKI1_9FLAO|nr:GNAT family N-acetyltransferase [Flavobacterium magnum]AWA31232.1 GNAT family N-acetyltransferase [Flavobacterium magnum]